MAEDVEVTLTRVATQLEGFGALLQEVREEQRVQGRILNDTRALAERVTALERWQTWALRTVVGLVIVAGLGWIAAAVPPT